MKKGKSFILALIPVIFGGVVYGLLNLLFFPMDTKVEILQKTLMMMTIWYISSISKRQTR